MASGSSSLVIASLAAIVAAALGPRITGPHDRAAGAPFVYTPPEGFVPASEENTRAILGQIVGGQRAWVHPVSLLDLYTPNITLTHTNHGGLVADDEIAKLAGGMPDMFAQSGVTWKEVRHDARLRGDGTRVALILGDCTKGVLHYRSMQMAFPDDAGTSIVTASFPADAAARWEPLMEASMVTATGVALRVVPPENWMYVAWGLGGGILAFLAMGLTRRGPKAAAG
jgi:hypothetical protein